MAGYVGNVPVPQSVREDQSFTATAGQTTFNTLGYTDGTRIKVTLNGVLLEGGGVDYTATNGSDVVLTSGAAADDIVRFETFNEFNLVNQNLTTPTFTDSASVTSTTTASVSVSGDTTATLSLKNNTHEDTDGGRESTLIFQGEQSGGEISTLAEIEASHDGTSDDEKGDLIFRTNDGSDGTSPTEAARIDSDRHFIVGKSAADAGATAGIELRNDGNARFTKAGATATFNRLTSDGTVATFQKDGATKGTIGILSGDLYIGDQATGLLFDVTGADAVKPFDTTTTAERDDGIDLGSSAARFKDLYLSGGVYLGGTVAANYLDDYEEGTFTPTMYATGGGTTSYGVQTGTYTKIGNNVTVNVYLGITGFTGSGGMSFGGFPFTQESSRNAVGELMLNNFAFSSSVVQTTAYMVDPSDVRLYSTRDNNTWVREGVDTSFDMYLSMSYQTA